MPCGHSDLALLLGRQREQGSISSAAARVTVEDSRSWRGKGRRGVIGGQEIDAAGQFLGTGGYNRRLILDRSRTPSAPLPKRMLMVSEEPQFEALVAALRRAGFVSHLVISAADGPSSPRAVGRGEPNSSPARTGSHAKPVRTRPKPTASIADNSKRGVNCELALRVYTRRLFGRRGRGSSSMAAATPRSRPRVTDLIG